MEQNKKYIFEVIVFNGEEEIDTLFINADSEEEMWEIYDKEYAKDYPNNSVGAVSACDLA